MSSRSSIAAIVVAAGRGERATASGEALPKQYRRLAGVPVLQRSLQTLLAVEAVDMVLPVIHPEHAELFAAMAFTHPRLLSPVYGGSERQQSVLLGLEALEDRRPDLVLIHDAARPLADADVIGGVIAGLGSAVGAIPVLPLNDTVKRSTGGQVITGTEERSTLFAAQTPQGFRFADILAAHRAAAAAARTCTDDSAVAEWAGLTVAMTAGSRRNLKLTRQEDFAVARRVLEDDMETRIGTGYDVHAFAEGDAVWLGGVRIPHRHRLQGHSDADVALHALTDALYGALGDGDIGAHFPPSDPQWRDAPSTTFLADAARRVRQRDGRIVNLDVSIVCEAPRIGPHVAAMKLAIAQTCGIGAERVAIKATTNERLGFVGREEGIAAIAVASIEVPREA